MESGVDQVKIQWRFDSSATPTAGKVWVNGKEDAELTKAMRESGEFHPRLVINGGKWQGYLNPEKTVEGDIYQIAHKNLEAFKKDLADWAEFTSQNQQSSQSDRIKFVESETGGEDILVNGQKVTDASAWTWGNTLHRQVVRNNGGSALGDDLSEWDMNHADFLKMQRDAQNQVAREIESRMLYEARQQKEGGKKDDKKA